MAWYRCIGGSGLPAGLQTDMDAVLNKKFSTSTTYPPADWPDTVNLMGPLPERTASGTIAHIEDGASEVPVKNWLVTLPASLSGYSSIVGTKSGKNLLNANAITNTTNPNNATIVNNGNGTITVTTTTQQNVKTEQKLKDICPNVKVGETYFLNATTTGTQKIIYLHQASVSWTYGSAKVITSQMLESDVSLYASGTNSTATISDLSLTCGSTASAYTAYEAPTQYTASLGRTIYGGTADIVTGEGTDENGNAFTFTPITPTPETENVCNFWADEGDSSVDYYGVGTIQPPIQPTLITKNITENGTYTASSDSADGYSEVTVSVQASAFLVNDTNWSTSGLTYSKSVTITTAGNYAIRWSSYSDRPTIKVNNTTLSFTYSYASRYAWYLNETVALGVGDTISFELSASGNNAYIAQVEEVE